LFWEGKTMSELESILRDARLAVAAKDSDALEDEIGRLDWLAMEQEPWSDELFGAVKSLLLDPDTLEVDSSWHLATLVEQHWNKLSVSQHAELRTVWPASFGRFGNWRGALVVADLLGDHYADDCAFDVLETMSRSAPPPHRALAAYGLGKVARKTSSGALHERAIEKLRVLANNESDDVRREARAALARLEVK
jgi:hypothetical protein